jgi:hypothetical protein
LEWQGVPFLFEKSTNYFSLSLSDIPKLIIDTPFSWEPVISGLIAGLLPSAIAYFALRNSYKLARYQTKLLDGKDFSRDFRAAAAEYVTELTMYTSDFQQWKIANKNRGLLELSKGLIPQELSKQVRDLENSKNKIMLLTPPIQGKVVIESIANTQNKMMRYIVVDADQQPQRDEFYNSANDFMFDCHVFLDSIKN